MHQSLKNQIPLSWNILRYVFISTFLCLALALQCTCKTCESDYTSKSLDKYINSLATSIGMAEILNLACQ